MSEVLENIKCVFGNLRAEKGNESSRKSRGYFLQLTTTLKKVLKLMLSFLRNSENFPNFKNLLGQ